MDEIWYWGGGDLQWNLFVEFDFGSCRCSVTPKLHEAQIEL
jgi:hypothetical protein